MDKKTLYRLFYLPKQIAQKKREIQRIWEKLTAMSPSLTGMPHTGGVHDKVGDGTVELVSRKEELEELVRGYEQEEKEINDWIDSVDDIQINLILTWIDSVDDIQINLILTLRFREKMSWNQVADEAGGINTEDSCRKMVDRYLEKGQKNDGRKDHS